MKVVAIVQARMGSTRLPNKVMKVINGRPMIDFLLARLQKATLLDQIIVATSVDPRNQVLMDHVLNLGFACEMGSEEDVLARYLVAAEKHSADVIVRITGDCPLVDSKIVDSCVGQFLDSKVDYLCNNYPPTYPDGLDVEVVKISALQRAMAESDREFDHEHVTPYIRESGFFSQGIKASAIDHSSKRWTVDDPEDFAVIASVFEHFSPNIYFGWEEVLSLQESRPDLFFANSHIERNKGAYMNKGQKLWQRAKRVIPGGNMLLSKRPEMFLPGNWPTYYSKAQGAHVWDLEGKKYTDMSIMGIGTNILGYGHPEVDNAVREAIGSGNMSTLNCPEEVLLAEKLVDIHPWSDMVRFARTGGEANAVAIRIARAASGRDKVAICGYHGWHDWYLSANLSGTKNLDGHLLPGLEPNGVPRDLEGTVIPFYYNDIGSLERVLSQHDIGVIVMEVSRNAEPFDGFLNKVRQLATKSNIVLIFDECTSGFRETFGGLHKKYNVAPDIAMFGKALGNGYAITAILGKREVMEAAQSTFISSTFWTERIGPVAALKTLEIMEREKTWEIVTKTGLDIRHKWQELADSYGIGIEHWGLPALAGFTIAGNNSLEYKTLITQEMLASNILASNCVYACIDHRPDIVQDYFQKLDPIFNLIKKCQENNLEISKLLRGGVCHGGFKRLN